MLILKQANNCDFLVDPGGVDYAQFETVIMTISLKFDGGSISKRLIAGPSCFYVASLPDELVEFDETFELQLSTDDPDIALFPNTTTINILNNDCMLTEYSRPFCETLYDIISLTISKCSGNTSISRVVHCYLATNYVGKTLWLLI